MLDICNKTGNNTAELIGIPNKTLKITCLESDRSADNKTERIFIIKCHKRNNASLRLRAISILPGEVVTNAKLNFKRQMECAYDEASIRSITLAGKCKYAKAKGPLQSELTQEEVGWSPGQCL